MTLDEQIAEKEAEGFKIIQEGRMLYAPDPRLTFSDRAEGFDISLLGRGWPDPPFHNRLLDDGERWVHMRKERSGTAQSAVQDRGEEQNDAPSTS